LWNFWRRKEVEIIVHLISLTTKKSTIISLLERLYEPDSGSVRVGGYDISDFPIAWYRRRLGLVSQEPTLFSGTIRENISFGTPEASEEEIIEAAKVPE